MYRHFVRLAIHENNPNWEERKELYFKVAKKYDAYKVGHDVGEKAGTSSLIFDSKRKIERGESKRIELLILEEKK